MKRDILVELEGIFYPRSVALIGASNRPGSFGRMFVEGLIKMGFENIHPVHPREKEIMGLEAYPSVKEIPGEVDLAIVLTPPEAVAGAVRECAEKG
jgi:acetyltransferase